MRKRLIYLSCGLLASLTLPALAEDASLVGWWQFNEGTGLTAADSSGQKNNGTLSGPVTWVPSWDTTTCLSFNGPYNFVRVADSPSLNMTDGITIAAWINPKWTGNNRIMQKSTEGSDDQYRLLKEWGNYIKFDLPGVGTLYPQDTEHLPPKNEWTHLAATYDGKAMKLYFNGKLIFQQAASGKATTSAGPLFIGTKHSTAPAGDEFNGMLDDVRIYNRGLSDAEVKAFVPAKLKAYKPSPADGATGVVVPLMQWTPGDTAKFENVYFGTSRDLTDADRVKTRQSVTLKMYYHPVPLVPGQTYYWRVDEIESSGTIITGDVWKFRAISNTAADPQPNDGAKWVDPNGITLSWFPGSGATSHDVYLGLSKDAVTQGTGDAFKGTKGAPVFDTGPLAENATYYWRVDETIGATKYPGPVWSFQTRGPGGGIKAEYYSNLTLTGVPSLIRIEEKIDFTWGANAPGPGVAADFSVRFSGEVDVPFSETYTFYANVHGAVRLLVNGQKVIENWMPHHMSIEYEGSIALQRGRYPIVMEFSDWQWGGAADDCHLSWSSPSIPKQIMTAGPLQPPVRAQLIYPKDDDVNVPQDATLVWSTGQNAATHDVYFGEDAAAVAAATPADAGIYQGSQPVENNTYSPGALDWNKTYYWRIDEVNAASADSPWTGSVWRFTTADFLVVDDFESYTDEEIGRIFQTWIDGWGYTTPEPGNPGNGTGSTVGYTDPPFAEHTIIHGGGSSMPLGFNNADSPFYSEAERTFDTPQNWTVNGVSILSLQVRGYPQVTSVAVTETGGKMSLSGDGADIWGTSDQFTYAYKTLNGDATIVAKVVSNGTGTNTWTKGGVMIRQSLNGDSTDAYMVITAGGGNGAAFQNRATTGLDQGANDAASNTNSIAVVAPPYWVKLERMGDTFTGYTSADGSSWTMVGTHDVVMTGPVYIGLCVTSGQAGVQRTFQFESIKTTGSVTGQWQGAVIDSPKYNSVQNLYVAIQDSANKVAVVTDATAVNSADWYEVRMPLGNFTGVSMTKVKKMFIGVGDRDNPVADGTGMLFIDDIRVIKP